MTKAPVRVAVLISGTGSNLRALVEGAGDTYAVALVLSNKAEAPGLAWAAERGIPTAALPHAPYGKDRPAHAAALAAALKLKDRLAGKKVAVVLSGGNISTAQLREILSAT